MTYPDPPSPAKYQCTLQLRGLSASLLSGIGSPTEERTVRKEPPPPPHLPRPFYSKKKSHLFGWDQVLDYYPRGMAATLSTCKALSRPFPSHYVQKYLPVSFPSTFTYFSLQRSLLQGLRQGLDKTYKICWGKANFFFCHAKLSSTIMHKFYSYAILLEATAKIKL